MVQPKQYQLENLSGDVTGDGVSNTVVSVTGSGGELDCNGATLKNIGAPVDVNDAATKTYVDAVLATPSLATVLGAGNVTGGTDIVITAGDNIVGSAGNVTVNDNLTVNGKLTVTGLIDPTALILAPQAAMASTNSIWLKSDAKTSLLFNNSDGTEVFKAGADTDPYIGVGASFGSSGALRVPEDDYLASNGKLLIGYNSGTTAVAIGDDATGAGLPINMYSGDYVRVVDPNGGAPQTRFTFDLGNSILEFDNSASSAGITYEAAGSGSGDTFTITGQNGPTSDGGPIKIVAGSSLGGTGDGGDITLQTGAGVGGGHDGYVIVKTNTDELAVFSPDLVTFKYDNYNLAFAENNIYSDNLLTLESGKGDASAWALTLQTNSTSGLGGNIFLTCGSGAATGGGGITQSCGSSSAGSGGSFIVNGGDGYTSGGSVTINSGDGTTSAAGQISLLGGDGSTYGGHINLVSGTGDTNTGGNINITTGASTTLASGALNITTGTGNTDGGAISIAAGDGTTGSGGAISISAGDGTAGSGGAVNISSGDGASSDDGWVKLSISSTDMFRVYQEERFGIGSGESRELFYEFNDTGCSLAPRSGWNRFLHGGRQIIRGTPGVSFDMYDLWPA